MLDYYKILGLSPDAPEEVVRAAYRALAAKYHPDKNPGDERAELKVKQLNAAFEVLGNPMKRGLYDDERRHRHSNREQVKEASQWPASSQGTSGVRYDPASAPSTSANQATTPRASWQPGRAYTLGRLTRRLLVDIKRMEVKHLAAAAAMFGVLWTLARITIFGVDAPPAVTKSAPSPALPARTSGDSLQVGMLVGVLPRGLERNGRQPLANQSGRVTVLDQDGKHVYVSYEGDILTFEKSEVSALPIRHDGPDERVSLVHRLQEYSEFEFFAESGTFETYSPLGKLIRREPDLSSFRRGVRSSLLPAA